MTKLNRVPERPKLHSGIIRVVVELDDGSFLEGWVDIDGRDMRRYEMVRAANNWPSYRDGGEFQWMAYTAWSALERAGELPPELAKYAAFEKRCIEARTKDDDDDQDDDAPAESFPTVDPTNQESEHTS